MEKHKVWCVCVFKGAYRSVYGLLGVTPISPAPAQASKSWAAMGSPEVSPSGDADKLGNWDEPAPKARCAVQCAHFKASVNTQSRAKRPFMPPKAL